ncbi:LysR substrate-binding domain-containing protein [Solirubrobacter ginsenosidimutans]|uniref:LysR substrate-binding domain-containing protein n=1 Tax=Solirubrobacter ginsenosidimutans TaxID=490573 RepID=A0A9X3S031_9ACTN|nr:LysR substrate-binding domain-containing protein [Solirubrobacter ginsenosidimutans]MDA0161580.1 LysR substrate-binding domain-containing protein [Solirubrobacter ginsenosidimutans]
MRNTHDLTLTGLRVVQEVAARGSFTAAADVLGYTQSAISRQVAAMEAAAGAPLFERHARGVRPTLAGTVLLRHAGPVLERVDTARLELGGLRDRLEGRLALGAYPTALAVLVPRALARLRAAHPAITVTLREGTTPTHLRRVRAGRLELAVVALDPDALDTVQDLSADVVYEGGLLLAVAETHRFAQRGTVDVGELATEPWIVGDSGAGDSPFGAWPGLKSPRIAHSVRDWPARLALVANGFGIAVVPGMHATTVGPGVALVAVDEPIPIRRVAVAVTRADRSPSAAATITALREEAAAL